MESADKPARPATANWKIGPLDLFLLAVLSAAKLLVHLVTANKYGYFRDELYFLDLARHLDWGYVDCAPLIAVYAKVALLLGGSLPVLRSIAAVAGAARVAVTMILARELGGGRFAQGLAGLCVLAAPIYLGEDSILTMNGFESLFWMGCVFFLIRIVRTGDSRLWVWFGVLAGLGLENKHSTLLFGGAVAIALLLSPERREILKPWIWVGAGLALLIFLPNILWQVRHGFPTLEDLQNVKRMGKNVLLTPLEFVREQILLLHPFLFPIWIAGLVSLLVGRGSRLRVLGWTYLVLLAAMIVLKAKNYYLAPIYPMLFASGAVAWEGWLERRAWSRGRLWPKAATAAYVLAAGAFAAPAILPILPPEKLLAYERRIGAAPPKTEVRHEGPLEQRLGDQFGWEELVADVARIYQSLPPAERARTGIFASNYGEAGAIDLFGPAQGLPPAICAHQNHFFWGPPTTEVENLIWLQWGRESIERRCRSVEQVGEHFHPWGMAEENRPIYLCRGLRAPLALQWQSLKHWN
ncbi:MAG TPA: glycosyltransferase family 39 protein [Thermoanaerobaculia bacterium]|nr:glycosyltransferase family 39 protein [Thermoanaerobaculia bacterium]